MRTKNIARLLLVEMVTVLVVHQTWSNFVELHKACVDTNGTVCNHRPPEECNFERLEPSPDRQRSAVNPESLFYGSVFINYSSPTSQRYLFIEWIPYEHYYLNDVTVRVSPLIRGRILDDKVICMSSLGLESNLESRSARSRHATVVPFPDNVTVAIVEININSSLSEYLFQTPKYGRYSWILQGASVTAQDNTGYISISSPTSATRSRTSANRIRYTVTLVCYTYNTTAQHPVVDKRFLKILSSSPVTNCSSTRREIILQQSATPIVFEMNRLAYSVVIDAQLVTGSSNQVIGEATLTTPIFVHVGATSGMNRGVSQKPSLEASTGQEFSKDSKMSASELSGTTGLSELSLQEQQDYQLTFPSKNGESVTEEGSTIFIWPVVGASALFTVVMSLFVAWRLRTRKYRFSAQQQLATSDRHDDTKATTSTSLPVTQADGPGVGSNRMSRFRSECCTHRVSDVPSDGGVSDPLISDSAASKDSFNSIYNNKNSHQTSRTKNNFYYDDLSPHLAGNNFLLSKDNLYGGHDHLSQSLLQRKHNYSELDDVMHEGEEDIGNTDPQTNMGILAEHLETRYRNLPHVTDFENGSNFMLVSTENSIYEEDDSEYECFCREYKVVKPELLSDPINPMIMKAECLKINQEYAKLTGIAIDPHSTHSCDDSNMDAECFSISESIAW